MLLVLQLKKLKCSNTGRFASSAWAKKTNYLKTSYQHIFGAGLQAVSKQKQN